MTVSIWVGSGWVTKNGPMDNSATLGVKARCVRTHAAVHLTRRRQTVSDSSEFRVILREQVVGGQRRRQRVTDGAVRDGLKPRGTVDAQPAADDTYRRRQLTEPLFNSVTGGCFASFIVVVITTPRN